MYQSPLSPRGLRVAAMAVVMLGALRVTAVASEETFDQKFVISIERIWDRPGHAAFTDLVRHGGFFYCTFREGSGHVPGLNGVVRVIRSRDGTNWESVAVLDEPHVDLRDPKLSVMPDGRLMVNTGASFYHGKERLGIESRVAFAESDGTTFGPPVKVVLPEKMVTGFDWLWRITWHEGLAWGCVQQVDSDERGEKGSRALRLVKSRDAIHFEEVSRLRVDSPSETTLRFLPDGTMAAMIRCEGKPAIGQMGMAKLPYTDWNFVESNKRFGGPNFVRLPGEAWLAGSRNYDSGPATTQLWWLEPQSAACREVLTLPSGGDCSYPGLVVDDESRRLYVSYYSSHEGKAAIYLATLRLDALQAAASE